MLVRPRHPSKLPIPQKEYTPPRKYPRAATRWVKGPRGLNYDEELTALKLQFLEKRRSRNDLALTHKTLYKQIDLFKLSRTPGLVISSLRLLHLTGRKQRRRNSFAYRVVMHWNWLIAHSIFAPVWSFWARCPFPFIKCIHSYLCRHVSERALDE